MRQPCDITIELDEPSGRFQAGEEVTGRVDVDVTGGCQCHALRVELYWRTRGKGTSAEGRRRRRSLFSGWWDWREEGSYEFSFELPNGPCSYDGYNLDVDWFVEACADLDGEARPGDECKILVEPAGEVLEEPYRTGDPNSEHHLDARRRREVQDSAGANIAGLLFVMMLIGGGGALLGMSYFHDFQGSVAWLVVPLALVFIGVGLRFFYHLFVRSRLAETAVGEVKAGVRTSRVAAGDEARIAVLIPAQKELKLREITVSLQGVEQIRYRTDNPDGGQTTTGESRKLYGEDYRMPESSDRRLEAGESARFEKNVLIPKEAAPSFYALHNKVEWTAFVTIETEGWYPDWSQKIPLDVVPAGG